MCTVLHFTFFRPIVLPARSSMGDGDMIPLLILSLMFLGGCFSPQHQYRQSDQNQNHSQAAKYLRVMRQKISEPGGSIIWKCQLSKGNQFLGVKRLGHDGKGNTETRD